MQKPIFKGRGSTGGGGRGDRNIRNVSSQNRMVIPRASMNAEVQLKKAENAWKPIRMQSAAGDKDPETLKTEVKLFIFYSTF